MPSCTLGHQEKEEEVEREEEVKEEEEEVEVEEQGHKTSVTSFPIVIHPPLPTLGVSPSSSSSSPCSSPPSSAVMGTE